MELSAPNLKKEMKKTNAVPPSSPQKQRKNPDLSSHPEVLVTEKNQSSSKEKRREKATGISKNHPKR